MEPTTSSRHQALVLKSIEAGFQLEQLPTPQAGLGGAIVRIKSAGILSYHGDVYNGTRHYTFPTPYVNLGHQLYVIDIC
jgi:D-arabinose 1-dehydrogenase-like Zn-dependent alcohol dehydrogenase